MDEMVYVAMTGAKQVEYAQAINSNNLANISTTGFRADLHSFSSIPVEGPGVDSRVNAVVESYGTDLGQGSIVNTDRPLDIAIRGDGFIAEVIADAVHQGRIIDQGLQFGCGNDPHEGSLGRGQHGDGIGGFGFLGRLFELAHLFLLQH